MSLFRRKPQPCGRESLFDDLDPQQEFVAYEKLSEWLSKRPRERWRYPILIGRARAFARTTPQERRAWALRMQARHGGLAVQLRYAQEGRDTITKARAISLLNRKYRCEAAEEAAWRKTQGLPRAPRTPRTKCWL